MSSGENDDIRDIRLDMQALKSLRVEIPGGGSPSETAMPDTLRERSSGLPMELLTAMDQLVAKTVTSEKTNDSLSSTLISSKIQFDDSAAIELHGATGQTTDNRNQSTNRKHSFGGIVSDDRGQPMTAKTGVESTVADQAIKKGETPSVVIPLKPNDPGESGHRSFSENRSPEWVPEATTFDRNSAITVGGQKPAAADTLLPQYLVAQMGRQIGKAIVKGDGVIRFRLKPPEMGAVKLEMDFRDDVLKLTVVAENRSTQEILLSHAQDLRDALQNQGVKLDKIDVQVGLDFDQAFADLNEQMNDQHRPDQDNRRSPDLLGDDVTMPPEGWQPDRSDILVDLMA